MVTSENSSAFSLADFKYALRKRWTMVALMASALMVFGAYMSARKPTLYVAESTVALASSETGQERPRSITNVRPIKQSLHDKTRTDVLASRVFLEVIDQFGLTQKWKLKDRSEALSHMKDHVTVTHRTDQTIQILVRDPSRAGAATLANAIAKEFLNDKEVEIQRRFEERVSNLELEIDNRKGIIANNEQRLRELNETSGSNLVESDQLRDGIIQQSHLIHSLEARLQLALVEHEEASNALAVQAEAIPEEALKATKRWTLPIVLSLIGLALGALIVGIFSSRSAPLQIAAEYREKLDVPLVGFAPVPENSLSKLRSAPDSIVEPHRFLRRGIQKLPAGDCSVISFAPASDAALLPEVVSNLSVIMAEGGRTVLLIDGNLRDPQLFEQFEAANHPGLSDFLSGEMRLQETVVKTRTDNLWLMPSGSSQSDPSYLFSSKRMEDLIYEMKSRFDYILIHSPSPLKYSEASILSELVDHSIIVSPYQATSEKTLHHLKHSIEGAGGILSGLILSQAVSTYQPQLESDEVAETAELAEDEPDYYIPA